MKVALVLEGGGLRGIFTAGVIDCFLDNDINFDYVCGVSAGACNTLAYLGKTKNFFKNCSLNNDGEKFFGARQFVETRHIVNLDMVFNEYASRFNFDWKSFLKNKTPWEMVVTNLKTGKPEYLNAKTKKKVTQIGRASCSIPLLTDPVKINRKLYLDGGTADSIPVKRAFELGYDKVVVVLTRKKGSYSKINDAELALMKRIYSKYPNFIRTSENRGQNYKDEVAFCEQKEKEGKLVLIRPTAVEVSRLESDQKELSLAYYHGYTKAKQNLDQIKNWLKK